MKTWKKTLLITSLSLTFLGAAMAYIGYLAGGLTAITEAPNNDYKHTTKTLTSLSSIENETSSYDIVIQESDQKTGSISYYQAKNNPITVTVKNGQLSIKERYTSKVSINLFSLKDIAQIAQGEPITTITITVPKGSSLKKVSSHSDMGSMALQKLDIEQLELTGDTSDITIENSHINKGKLEFGSGDITISNTILENLTSTIDSGDMELDHVKFINSDIQMYSGDISGEHVIFNGTNNLSIDSGDADIELSDYHLSVRENSDTGDTDVTSDLINSEKNFLTIDTGSGDISIN